MTIASIMTTDVLTVSSKTSFAEIQETFRRVPFHHLLVEDNGTLLGIISDRDLMSQVSKYVNDNNGESFTDFLPRLCAADVMSRDCIVTDPECAIDAAAILLLEHNFSCLPVVDEDYNIKGIVTWKDLLKFYIYR